MNNIPFLDAEIEQDIFKMQIDSKEWRKERNKKKKRKKEQIK
jgi:hypothetical protein